MKKGMILSAALSVVGLMLVSCSRRAGDEHDYNASNHGHGSACTARANDNNYDSHERQRLLIAKAGVGSSCRTGRLNIRLKALNSDASRTDRYRVTHSGFLRPLLRFGLVLPPPD